MFDDLWNKNKIHWSLKYVFLFLFSSSFFCVFVLVFFGFFFLVFMLVLFRFCSLSLSQDLKNQILTTNVWVEHVSTCIFFIYLVG